MVRLFMARFRFPFIDLRFVMDITGAAITGDIITIITGVPVPITGTAAAQHPGVEVPVPGVVRGAARGPGIGDFWFLSLGMGIVIPSKIHDVSKFFLCDYGPRADAQIFCGPPPHRPRRDVRDFTIC